MILVDVDAVTVTRPERPLFDGVSVTIDSGDRLGVLGINGAGKSTLLRVMVGATEPESGQVRRARDLRMAILDQRPDLGTGTVRDAVGSGWEVESVLDRLGVSGLLDRRVAELSGGQAKRVALAAALVSDVDLLVLDEPTNHLDIEAIEWLENRLARFGGGLVVVTHDRQLLDRLCNRVLSLDRARWHLTEGGYKAHLDAEAEREAKAARDEQSRRILARQELAWLQRGARARRRKPKSRIAEARAVIDGGPKARSDRLTPLGLDSFGSTRLGSKVIDLEGVSFAYPDGDPLFSGLDHSLAPGGRLGIVGANGGGKSTLLDVMARRLEPTSGTVEWGTTVRLGYFDQLGRDLDPDQRVREAVVGDDGKLTVAQQQLFERFWFDNDAQQARIGSLSGGERRRLELLLVLGEGPNVLFLDEPTNDLDLDTLRSLEGFLDDWPGSLAVVSHDRVFLERTVEHVVQVGGGAVVPLGSGEVVWKGVVDALAGENRRAGKSAQRAKTKGATKRRTPSTLRRLISQVEEEMSELEAQRDRLDGDLSVVSDHVAAAKVAEAMSETVSALASTEERWLDLSTELDDLA
ncbi:MAG: ABC-F family ATP-binding cassette domain-containing protein [Actinomycetia bacterium]|nr:ABC-F family ATP-binding cassette domain-containing protein [Actinomycetes bacterium]MCP4960971.1 ABC-F family ATP-binding cassette domain-containing protein [Actinomycetes bacterium]